MNNTNKTTVSFWGLSVEERKEIVGRLFPTLSGLRIQSMTIEQEDKLVEIPRVPAVNNSKAAIEPVLKVCMGSTTEPNHSGYLYDMTMVDAVKERIRRSNLFGEYGSPQMEIEELPQDQKLERSNTVDLDKVSHEVMDIEVIDDMVYIYIRMVDGKYHDVLIGAEKPSFGVRGACRITSKESYPHRTFTSITSFDYLGDKHVGQ